MKSEFITGLQNYSILYPLAVSTFFSAFDSACQNFSQRSQIALESRPEYTKPANKKDG